MNAKKVLTFALVICLGMATLWVLIAALADELDPIRGVASTVSALSLVLALFVAIAAAVYVSKDNRKKKTLSHRRQHRSRHHDQQ